MSAPKTRTPCRRPSKRRTRQRTWRRGRSRTTARRTSVRRGGPLVWARSSFAMWTSGRIRRTAAHAVRRVPSGQIPSNFDCIEGRCVLGCRTDYEDCDGVVDNGCEADLRSDDHCGSCGNKCTEEAPCVRQPPTNQKVGCGCAAPNSYCKPDFPWQDACVDLKFADNNCGACGVVCDPTGGLGAPPRSPQYTLRMRRRGVRQVQVHERIRRLQHGYRTAELRRVRDATEHARHCGQCGDDCRARGMNCVLESSKESRADALPGRTSAESPSPNPSSACAPTLPRMSRTAAPAGARAQAGRRAAKGSASTASASSNAVNAGPTATEM